MLLRYRLQIRLKKEIFEIFPLSMKIMFIFSWTLYCRFSGFTASVYHTSLSNITSPATWTEIISLNASGYLWGIYADGSRLWFIQGTPIAIYNGTPSTAVSADKTFHILDMSDYDGGHLNSACFIAPSLPMLFGVRMSVSSKSLASHIRLAKEARELAEKLKKKE